ncbi:MAG: hypothetical protein R3309_16470 [Reinekea sp.]|nr:hypothetical protein [Reinekea sp.]MDX1475769.1 hypothetical protein [Reinekea sp.]
MQVVIRTSQGLLFLLVIALASVEWGGLTPSQDEPTQYLSQLTR